MKNTLIIQLSDLHLTDKFEKELLSHRAKLIARSAIRKGPYSAVLLIVSGDIAFSGKTSEFLVAEDFFTELDSELEKLSSCNVKMAFTPGNHDCDFSKKSRLRELVINTSDIGSIENDELLSTLVEPLENFRRFEARMSTFPFSGKIHILKDGIINLPNGQSIQLKLVTSPIFSTIDEKKGSLLFPPPPVIG